MTKIERLLLANQFRILAKLISAETDYYDNMIEIVEQGYTREYASLTDAFTDELSKAICGTRGGGGHSQYAPVPR